MAELGQGRHARLLAALRVAVVETGEYIIIDADTIASPEVCEIRRLLGTYSGPHTKPDLVLLHVRTGALKIVDVSFAHDRTVVRNDAIRHLIRDNYHWWTSAGIIKGLVDEDEMQDKEVVFGETDVFGSDMDADSLLEAIKSTSRKPSKPASHKVNPLVPHLWDDAKDVLHFPEDFLFDLKWLPELIVGVEEAVEAYMRRYAYSPRARYYHRYTPLLAHITSGHTAWLDKSPVSETRGALLRLNAKHVVLPFVTGHCGTPTKASLEAATMLLCENTKSTKAAESLCVKAMWIAIDAAIKFYAQWF
jgi:hypothetical protein